MLNARNRLSALRRLYVCIELFDLQIYFTKRSPHPLIGFLNRLSSSRHTMEIKTFSVLI